jgi:tripartite-type tricarboxylate transporter receptor subunit TctC
MRYAACAVFGAVLAVIFAAAADAQSRAPITLAISSEAGGGGDQYARLVARHLQRELPGNPPIIPKNMVGASGVLLMNWGASAAARDGSVILATQGPSVLAPLQGLAGAQYDPRKFSFLLSIGNLTNMLVVWHSAPVVTVEDVRTRGMVLGNGSTETAIIPAMLNRLIGTRFKIIAGYPGTNAVALAMERGEVDGTVNIEWGSLRAVRANWLAEGKIRIPLQVTFHPVPELPGVPSIADFVRDDEQRDMLEILLAKQDIGRPFLSPPGVPPAIVATQRQALARMARDPQFLAEAERLQLSIDPTPGEALAALVDRLYAIPPATIVRLQAEIERARGEILQR